MQGPPKLKAVGVVVTSAVAKQEATASSSIAEQEAVTPSVPGGRQWHRQWRQQRQAPPMQKCTQCGWNHPEMQECVWCLRPVCEWHGENIPPKARGLAPRWQCERGKQECWNLWARRNTI